MSDQRLTINFAHLFVMCCKFSILLKFDTFLTTKYNIRSICEFTKKNVLFGLSWILVLNNILVLFFLYYIQFCKLHVKIIFSHIVLKEINLTLDSNIMNQIAQAI